jgi:hypothetical protein
MAAVKKSEIFRQQEIHRGDPQGSVLSFLVNYSASARLMHSFLPPTKGKEDILQAAMRVYVIGIADCVETFLRDLDFYLLKRNPSLLERALHESNRRELASRLTTYPTEGVSARGVRSLCLVSKCRRH